MLPIDIGSEYGIRKVYAATQPQYKPLITNVDNEGAIFSIWSLSEDERTAIANGANIGLRMLTFGQALQPVYLAVENTAGWPYQKVEANANNIN